MRYAYHRAIGAWRTLDAWWYVTTAPTSGAILAENGNFLITESGSYLVIE